MNEMPIYFAPFLVLAGFIAGMVLVSFAPGMKVKVWRDLYHGRCDEIEAIRAQNVALVKMAGLPDLQSRASMSGEEENG